MKINRNQLTKIVGWGLLFAVASLALDFLVKQDFSKAMERMVIFGVLGAGTGVADIFSKK